MKAKLFFIFVGVVSVACLAYAMLKCDEKGGTWVGINKYYQHCEVKK